MSTKAHRVSITPTQGIIHPMPAGKRVVVASSRKIGRKFLVLFQIATMGAVARMPWFTPEYLEARLREQEHERRLAEFEMRMMNTPPRPRLLELLRQTVHTLLKRR